MYIQVADFLSMMLIYLVYLIIMSLPYIMFVETINQFSVWLQITRKAS